MIGAIALALRWTPLFGQPGCRVTTQETTSPSSEGMGVALISVVTDRPSGTCMTISSARTVSPVLNAWVMGNSCRETSRPSPRLPDGAARGPGLSFHLRSRFHLPPLLIGTGFSSRIAQNGHFSLFFTQISLRTALKSTVLSSRGSYIYRLNFRVAPVSLAEWWGGLSRSRDTALAPPRKPKVWCGGKRRPAPIPGSRLHGLLVLTYKELPV